MDLPMSGPALSDDFGVSLSPKEFEQRFLALHKQLFASTEFKFDDVTKHVFTPPKGWFQVDHTFWHDGENWHCMYVTGDMSKTDEYIDRFKAGDWEGAAAVTIEPGNGHAVGPTLDKLQFKENVLFPSQGRFDMITRGVGSLFEYNGRIGFLYDVRGENFIGMSLASTNDFENWELDEGNPYLTRPEWAREHSECKDPHVMLVDGVYLIYYITMDKAGYCCVALASTTDWKTFHDEGIAFRSAPMLRGTIGIESPGVALRDGMWHLYFTYGPGLWHAVSPSPKSFVGAREGAWSVGTGLYLTGPFHATEMVEHNGEWWLTTDRKEETRRLNRVAGRLCYRGSYEDEKTLEEGIYLSKIEWKGDQPIFVKP